MNSIDEDLMALAGELTVKIDIGTAICSQAHDLILEKVKKELADDGLPLVPYTFFDNAKAQVFQIAINLEEYVPLGDYFRDKYFELR